MTQDSRQSTLFNGVYTAYFLHAWLCQVWPLTISADSIIWLTLQPWKKYFERNPIFSHLQCWESCRRGHLWQKCMPIPTLCKGKGGVLKFFKFEGNFQIFFPPLSQYLEQCGNFFWLTNQTFYNFVFVLKATEANIYFDLWGRQWTIIVIIMIVVVFFQEFGLIINKNNVSVCFFNWISIGA